jgi:protein-disulfide isomerase
MNRRTIVVAVALVAIALLAVLVLRDLGSDGRSAPAAAAAASGSTAPGSAEQTATLVRFHSPVIGPATAPVTIVEFLDPACEACGAFHPYVKAILAANPHAVRLVIRYVPFHGEVSVEGVRILEAARAQGQFEAVLDALLESQPAWARHGGEATEQAWQIAGAAGLDLDQARALAATGAADRLLEQEVADVTALDVTRTPTFFVNGRRLQQSDPDALAQLVRSETALLPLAQ